MQAAALELADERLGVHDRAASSVDTERPVLELAEQRGVDQARVSSVSGRSRISTSTSPSRPRAASRVTTIQACGVRDRSREYERADAVVLGVSPDPSRT
jgi:hypothetical protein